MGRRRSATRVRAGGLSLLAVASTLMATCNRAPEPVPRSVVLITIDTLRADRTSMHGYGYDTSPELRRLADRGLRFESAFSASSSTAPSHASILTGRYPSWLTVGSFNAKYELDESHTTLAEILEQQAFRTGAIVSNPILGRFLGLDQGFGSYDDRLEGRERNRPMPERYADRAVDLAMEWLAGVGDDEPFFLWLHLQDPHGPYAPPRGWSCGFGARGGTATLDVGTDHSGYGAIPSYQVYDDERLVSDYARRYDCEVAFMDAQLGRVLRYLDEAPRFRETLVVLTADHGEAFGEDGFHFAHGHGIGLDQIQVPLVLAGPGIEPGSVSDAPVTNVAVFRTVLDWLGLDGAEGSVGPGLLEPGGRGAEEPVFVECLNQVGIVQGATFVRRDRLSPADTRVWRAGNPNSGGGHWEPLGRIVTASLDPSETVSREVASGLVARLEEFEARAASARATCDAIRSGAEFTPERREALRSLGYLH